MTKSLKNFLNFVREHGVIGLAVGLAIGTQVGKFVETIVKGFIDPIVGLIIGDTAGLSSATFTVTIGSRVGVFYWGAIVSGLITLLAVSAVIYYVVTGLKLDKVDKKK